MLSIKRIQKQNVSEQVYEQLKDNIFRQYWLPGTKIPSENVLADMFEVSRVSVRAAIQKLIALGILESRNGEGTFVKKFSASIYLNSLVPMLVLEPRDIVELLEFRRGLEMLSCELAAERATQEEIIFLGNIMDRMNKSCTEGNIDQYSVDDFDFHLCIAKMSKNSVIENVLMMLKDPIFKHLEEMNKRFGLELGINYHRNVYEAIKNGDAKAASHFIELSIKRSISKMKEVETNI